MSELRPKIVKLAKMVGGIAGAMNKIDENSPEYYSLDCVVTDDMADIAMILGLRKPRTFDYVAQRSGRSTKETRELLDQLTYTGVAKVWKDKEDKKDRYFVNIFAPGMLEMMVNNREQLAAHPEIGKAFEEYTRLRLAPMAAKFPQGMAMMRVIPVEAAIKDLPGTQPWERLSYYLDKYDTFSVSDCSCRQSRKVLDEGCGHLEQEICVQMGEGAEYYIRSGRGREITRQEAEEILRFAEDNGLMHEMPHTDGLGESAAICNCCSCSCFSLRLATLFHTPDAIRSNFTAVVNTENCVACGQCVESCPSNALKLGGKLCSKTPVPETTLRTARDHIWKESNWNVNYRENREDVAKEGTSPCKTACPAHISVQGYIKLAAQGRYHEALELIKRENPFPAVCGRICPHSCESECTRGDIDEPIAIDEIKKFIADKELDGSIRYIPPTRYQLGNKIAVIGSGPAGLSCAYYLGAQGGRKLGIPGENTEGVIPGVDFLRQVNLGKGAELSGNVVIIGGGNVAIDVARTATRQGAANTMLYCLEKPEEMPALPEEIKEAEEDGIVFHNGWGPSRILTENGKVTGVEFKHCISVFDEKHRFSPKYDEKDTITVEADYVLLSIGQSILWEELLTGSKVALERGNTVKVDSLTWQTEESDIFAGGDCCTGPKYAIDAIAAGKEGAVSIHRYVQPGQSLVFGRDRREYHSFDKSNIAVSILDFDSTPRQRPGYLQEKKGSFYDDRLTFTEEQLKKETNRCLGCGAVELNSYMCLGCGMCTTKCKFDAIHLERTYNSVPDTYEKLPIKIAANAIVRTGKIATASVKESIGRKG